MSPALRALAVAAMAGGALRIADAFLVDAYSVTTLAILYFATDVLLLAGIAGVYWGRSGKLGVAGTLGVAIFTLGILLVRVAAFGVFGDSGYRMAATIALVGLAILSTETWIRRNGAYVSATFWLLALALGIAGACGLWPAAMLLLAGIAFGAGFVAAGAELLAA